MEPNTRRKIFEEVAQRIERFAADRIVRVAIDGVDGAGKTTFADELAETLRLAQRPVIRASVDGFHNPKAVRYRRGRDSPEGFFEDSYDYAALRKYLLDPLGPEGCRLYRTVIFDHLTDRPVPVAEQRACPSSILLFDGIFLHRPELRPHWDLSIFLQVDFDVSVARCAVRDGTSADPDEPGNLRYVQGQRLYLTACRPTAHATLIIDYNDLDTPILLPKGGVRVPV